MCHGYLYAYRRHTYTCMHTPLTHICVIHICKRKAAQQSHHLQACFCFRANRWCYRFDKPSFRKRVRYSPMFSVWSVVREDMPTEEREREGKRERETNSGRTYAYTYTRLVRSHAHEDTLYRRPWLRLSLRSVSASSFVFSPK